ncbi:MAG TPA: pentapeptide repeat-containing protein [Rhizomicrobium sp.]
MFASAFLGLTLILGLGASAPAQMIPISYTAPDRTAVDSIKAGNHDCPHCMLAGANLDNTCVKNGNLEGADFSHVHAVLMCMSYANFTNVSFRDANLSGANLAHADLTNADFTGATLSITSFKGTDLTKTKGLTQAQLDSACSDKDTKVPTGLKAHICT